MELTIDNIAALYFTDYFHLALTAAGLRGRILRDDEPVRARPGRNRQRPLQPPLGTCADASLLLGCTIFAEGSALMLFSQMRVLPLAIAFDDAGRAVRQDVQRRDLFHCAVRQQARVGRGSGNRGRGRKCGRGARGLPFQVGSLTWPQALLILGVHRACAISLSVFVRFSESG